MVAGGPQLQDGRDTAGVLLCTVGLAPQVVTETLYALASLARPRFRPARLILLSTAAGLELARRTLFQRPRGAVFRLAADWPEVRVPEPEFVTLEGPRGPLPDIRSSEEAASAADQICSLLHRLTREDMPPLHVSIAGGRKTMGAVMAAAMSVYARRDDAMSHVLVSPPYENRPDFFYPDPADPESQRAVTLARIPLVSLRGHLPDHLLARPLSYEALVREVTEGLSRPRLEIDLVRGDLRAAGVRLGLPPLEAAFYAWLALMRTRGGESVTARAADASEFLDIYDRFLVAYGRPVAAGDRVRQALKEGFDPAWFNERKSRINAALRRQLGSQALPFLIMRTGRRPESGLAIALPPAHIRVVR